MKEKGNAGSQVPESEERHGNRLDGRGTRRGRKEPESTGGTADRGEREEGKGKNGRPSSQNRAEADERKQKVREKPESESKREAPVEQLWERNREG